MITSKVYFCSKPIFNLSACLNGTVSDRFKLGCGGGGRVLVHGHVRPGLRGGDNQGDRWSPLAPKPQSEIEIEIAVHSKVLNYHSHSSGLPCNYPRPLEGSLELVHSDPEDETVKVELCSNGKITLFKEFSSNLN